MPSTKKVSIIISILIFILGIAIGKFIIPNNLWSREVRLTKQYKFTNPLLECDSNIGNTFFPNSMKNKIEQYITNQTSQGKVTNVAVYFRDLNNGPWFGINQSALFSPASLIKVPLMMTFYKMSEKDPNLLNTKIKVTDVDENLYNSEDIQPDLKLNVGQEYTIDQLIDQMIINSDNNAYNILKEYAGEQNFYEIFNDLNIDLSKIDSNGNVISIHDYSAFFRILYNSSYLNQDNSEKALNLLSRTTYKNALVAGVPSTATVSHKFGERSYSSTNEKQLHDCGIIYAAKNPYILCVMSRGNDLDQLSKVISNISALVYNSIDR
jgi:beta-lactamase class A